MVKVTSWLSMAFRMGVEIAVEGVKGWRESYALAEQRKAALYKVGWRGGENTAKAILSGRKAKAGGGFTKAENGSLRKESSVSRNQYS